MKRLIILMLLFYSLSGNSQTYYPFPVDSAVWTVDFITPQFPFGNEYHVPIGYTIIGDSLINGLLYSKIYTSDSAGNSSPWGLVALTREQNKVVYCKYVGSGNQLPNEVILYDFNLAPGDTFSFPSYGNQTILVVDSIGAIQTSTGNRNAFYFSIVSNPGAAYYFNPVWVEGIGDIVNGVIYHEVPWVDWWCEGLCFTNNSSLVWSRYSSHCWLNTGINDVSLSGNTIKCHPNPSDDNIIIALNNLYDLKTIQVFEASGRKVFETQIQNNEFVLKKQDVGYGVFLLRIITNHKDVQLSKIVFTN